MHQVEAADQGHSSDKDHAYFALMEVVGTSGRYQTISIILWAVICFVEGSVSLGTSMLFYLEPYANCPPSYNTTAQACKQYVCSLPFDERSQYQQVYNLKTLGNYFVDFNCEDNTLPLQFLQSCNYIGNVIGYIIIPFFSDNLGRKLSMTLSLMSAVCGFVVVYLAGSIEMSQMGFLLIGFGQGNAYIIIFSFVNQTVQNERRQKYSVIFQTFYPLGGLAIALWFYLFKDWKVICLFFYLTPLFIATSAFLYFIQDTPQFLVKKLTNSHTLNAFRQIALINDTLPQFEASTLMTVAHFNKLKQQFQQELINSNKVVFTTVDLFRFKSLRLMTLCIGPLNFFLHFLYYGPVMLLTTFGMNMYVTAIVLNASEILTIIFSFNYIHGLQRKFTALCLLTIAFVMALLLNFVHSNSECMINCESGHPGLELLLIFVFRFCVSLQLQLLYIYIGELFPTVILGLGFGFACIIGTSGSSVTPFAINQLKKVNFPIMLLFAGSSLISILLSLPLPETYGQAPNEDIQELAQIKNPAQRIELVEEGD